MTLCIRDALPSTPSCKIECKDHLANKGQVFHEPCRCSAFGKATCQLCVLKNACHSVGHCKTSPVFGTVGCCKTSPVSKLASLTAVIQILILLAVNGHRRLGHGLQACWPFPGALLQPGGPAVPPVDKRCCCLHNASVSARTLELPVDCNHTCDVESMLLQASIKAS